jgi:uncharacterized membrane protein YqjE
MNTTKQAPNGEQARVGDLLHRITDDVKTIAKNEVELARIEIENTAKSAAADAAVILLGGIVALIGLGLLCSVVVVALAPVIPQLWLRLLIMAVVYLALGGTVAGVFAKKLQKDIKPNLDLPAREAQQTVAAIKDGLSA